MSGVPPRHQLARSSCQWQARPAAAGLVLSGASVQAELPALISREVLFGNPDRTRPQISADGTKLAYVAPDAGVLNVWVRTFGQQDDRVVTRDRRRGIREYHWVPNGRQMVYCQDKNGDENAHLYLVDLADDSNRDLTPFENIQAWGLALEQAHPDEMILGINNRDPKVRDVYRADLKTGKLTLIARNDQGFTDWAVDHDLNVRAGERMDPDGGKSLWVYDPQASRWRVMTSWGMEDSLASNIVGFTPDNKGLYVVSSTGSDMLELREMDFDGKEKRLAGDAGCDVGQVLCHPFRHTIQAVSYERARREWKVIVVACKGIRGWHEQTQSRHGGSRLRRKSPRRPMLPS